MGGYVRFTNGGDAFLHSKRTPLEGIEVLCSKGVYHTNWNGGHLWRVEANGKLEEDVGFFEEFGGRALDGAQRHASASRNPIDRRLPRQRHRPAVPRRQQPATGTMQSMGSM